PQELDLLDPRHLTGWLADLVRQGYAAIVVERPGAGASFGKIDPTPQGMAREADQVLRWIAGQDWSNGRIGMWG
ncbi:MAG TPA: CocE/NonD family hydrolase, partial [Candidatus Eisenbacteria bacterium]|nr:CocE/NonD family hydrolase [Candidatus Eisenbacteria bacterium]